MRTVFLALGQYSHYSDILRGRLLPALAERYRVVVLTPLIDGAIAERDRYFLHPNVSYRKLDEAHPRLWVLFDKYLRVPFIREFDHLTYMRYFYQRPHWWVRKLLMRLRVLLPRNFLTAERITRWETRLCDPALQFRELVRVLAPALLITATPGFSTFEAEMIVCARRLGIRTAAVDINYDNLTSNGKMIRKTDYLCVWNERMAREAKDLHRYPDDRLARVGCLRFDHYVSDRDDRRFRRREDFLAAKGLDPGKPTIALAGPTPANYPPRRELVAELIGLRDRGAFSGNPNLLIRIHPNDALSAYAEFLSHPGVCIERAGRQTRPDAAGGQKVEMNDADFVNLTETLVHADVILNFASTVIMEACIFDRPVISVGFPEYRRIVYEYEYNKGLLDTGAVRLARSPDDLAELVNAYLGDPSLDRSFRRQLVDEYLPFCDGRAYERTLDLVGRLTEPWP